MINFNRKGFLFTLSLLLLALVIIQLTQVVRSNVQESEAVKKNIIGIDRVSVMHENIQDNLEKIFENTTGINFTVSGNIVYFSETLSKKTQDNSFKNFKTSLDNYKKFLETQQESLQSSLSYDLNSDFDLTIVPQNLTVRHADVFKQGGKSNNKVSFLPQTMDINSYSIDITLENESFDSIQTNPANPVACTSCAKPTNLSLIVRNSSKIPKATTIWANIDPAQQFTITINSSGNSPKDIEIALNNGSLTITNDNSTEIGLVSGIDFGIDSNSSPSLKIQSIAVNVSDPILAVEKN
ncbi:MAG: hypothetical protein Q7K42_04425 [Candidatus Diapherotrites archaeon]|nr:hypothetical protein [Candidatus Diapherotrites archaeon]